MSDPTTSLADAPVTVRRKRRSPFDEWAADNATVVSFLTAPDFDAEGSRYLSKLARRLASRSALSPEEVSAVERNIIRRQDRDRRLSDPASDVASLANGEHAPAGRTEVEGVIVEVSIRPGFDREEPDRKMTVDCGYLVWCTVPQSLIRNPHASDLGLVGAKVRFSATLAPRTDNPCIAVGKAPRTVTLLSPPASGDPATTRVA